MTARSNIALYPGSWTKESLVHSAVQVCFEQLRVRFFQANWHMREHCVPGPSKMESVWYEAKVTLKLFNTCMCLSEQWRHEKGEQWEGRMLDAASNSSSEIGCSELSNMAAAGVREDTLVG